MDQGADSDFAASSTDAVGVAARPSVHPGGDTDEAEAGPSSIRSRRGIHLAILVGYVIVGVVLWWHVWITGHPTTTITCHCDDPSQELWFLTWTPWAIIHGHSPFITNAIYSGQGGANLLITTSFIFPATVLAPITWIFGPVASFNVAATLGPPVTAWCFYLAARTVTKLLPVQVIGGLLFGFSPFVISNDPFGHLNFTLLFFPSLAFILLYDLCVTHRRPPVRIGLLLGALIVVQFFTGTEVLAICGLVIAFALIAAALLAPRAAWRQRRRLTTAFATMAGSVIVVLAYPMWLVIDGPRRITGFVFPNPSTEGASPSAVINAGIGVHHSSVAMAASGYLGGAGPNEGSFRLPSLIYLGLPLVILIVVSVVTWFRYRLAWVIAITTLVAWVLSFGASFEPTHFVTTGDWWLPWRIFASLPLLGNIFPLRFGFIVMFGVALLLVISLDRWENLLTTTVQRGDRHLDGTSTSKRTARRWSTVVVTVVGIAVLTPVALTNSVPFDLGPSTASIVPEWFTVDAPRLSARTVVLVVPFSGESAMGWQALSGLHYDLVDGESVVPGSGGESEFVSPSRGAIGILDRLSGGADNGLHIFSTNDVEQVRSSLVRWHVGVTVVVQSGPQSNDAIPFMTAVYGRPPLLHHGVWEWNGTLPNAGPAERGSAT